MTPERIFATRRCLMAGLAALKAIERCQVLEARAAAIAYVRDDDTAAWSSRVRAERQHEDGVKARAAAEVAVVRYRQLKAEVERA